MKKETTAETLERYRKMYKVTTNKWIRKMLKKRADELKEEVMEGKE